ncbi:chromatin-remodeling ATPase INO80-like [Dendronephthya gigantea]|uniref:chromatin-remodeling ATPase INO80-like n=1 Tax=Dendronephthya gigantea TaxID=151771 RepID=UPI00106A3C4F|nr:chromatin-remodeling ATPase INO80-like [Dendronephthya gigantea]XP_028398664.1 chromatin-remodeling ATPase INO80-like [Dendronephthya gigantea]
MELSSMGQEFTPAAPLHIQRLNKALQLDVLLREAGKVFTEDLSETEESGLSDFDKDYDLDMSPQYQQRQMGNEEGHEECSWDKSNLYNFSKIKKNRQWLKEILLSDSSESSDDDEHPITEDDFKQMLRLHKEQKLCRRKYMLDKNLDRYKHYSIGLLSGQDRFHETQRPRVTKKLKEKPDAAEKAKLKKEKLKGKKKKKATDEDGAKKSVDEKPAKKRQSRTKDADVRRRKIWAYIARKEIPRTQRQKNTARNTSLQNAKKLAQLCQKEMKREALRSQKVGAQTVPRARRLAKEMLVYWKKYEKVEKEHRKKAEKEAIEQRKIDFEMNEAKRQQRKLNFLITQTELYAHFMSRKLKGPGSSDAAQAQVDGILKKLEFNLPGSKVKNMGGGVVIDLEHNDDYDSEQMKNQALQNAQQAFNAHENWTKAFDDGAKKPMNQQNFDQAFSLANPSIKGQDVPQPDIFDGKLKSYQLKGMNWLVNLYEQGINGILADEMGLGKTVQSIAFLSYLAEAHNIWGPFLVVAPASTLHNWQQEVTRFVPAFKVLPYWGNQSDRKSLRKYWNRKQSDIHDRENAPFHVLITSYQLVVQDVRYFQRVKWQNLVLDEAQAIKSSSSVRWKILLGFTCRNRLLLTGTPIQNSMAELWALLHFIMPTLFDSHDEFNEWFSKDIESSAEKGSTMDQNQLSRLHMILKPFMLRRIKRDVENELSDKIEIKVICELTSRQKWLYRAIRNKISIEDLVQTSTSTSASSSATNNLMNIVMQFRKVCNHPELFERHEVTSPLNLSVKPFSLPKLIFREGLLCFNSPGKSKILFNMMNIGSEKYIHNSLFPRNISERDSFSCFSFLRFINLAPSEACSIMTKDVAFRFMFLLLLLEDAYRIYHRRLWNVRTQSTRYLSCQDLLLWPSFRLSYPEIRFGPITKKLVFTGPTMTTNCHMTHKIVPVVSDDDHKRHHVVKKNSPRRVKDPSSPTKLAHSPSKDPHSPTKHPTSPTKKAHSPTKHLHLPVEEASNLHPPPKVKSPTKHHPPGGGHHRSHPHHHTHQRHHHHHKHHGKGDGDVEIEAPKPEQATNDTIVPPELDKSQPDKIEIKKDDSSSGKSTTIVRLLQPTSPPKFLLAYIPKVVAQPAGFYTCDRSGAYKASEMKRSTSHFNNNLLLYGALDHEYLEQRKHEFFPQPLGGFVGMDPKGGWSHIQIPDREILITDSGKMKELDRLLTRLKFQGHRVLIYSQMTKMIDLLEEYMAFRKHKYMRLDGSSKISERRDMVANFQTKSDIFAFLLSTRAGGLGINLTAADTVIFYDSDWNPTVDQQAMDRAHRLGQTRQVTVYRLIARGTIEERILQRAQEKSEIQKMVISGGQFKPDALKPKEVVSLLLDDEEMECKFIQKQAEKKADDQKKRRERKRKQPDLPPQGEKNTTGSDVDGGQAKKRGRKKKVQAEPPPLSETSDSRGPSEIGSTNGEIINMKMETADVDVSVADDVSIQSLDDVSVASGDGLTIDLTSSIQITPSKSDAETSRDSPSSHSGSKTRGRARGRGRGRGRTSGRGRGRGRARGASGALAAAAAAMAGAAAGSAAAYAAYGFSYQASAPTPPSNRVSPVAFGAGPSPSSGGGYKQQNTGVALPSHVSRHEGSANTPPDGEQINVTRVETNSSKNHKRNEGSTT